MTAIRNLEERLAELSDLGAVQMLAEWDQLVMMPSAGARSRAHQLATQERLIHERATDPAIGEWLAQLEGQELSPLQLDMARIARRDWERAARVPSELAAGRAHAAAEGQEIWQVARAEDDFQKFAPALERNVELARAYGEAVSGGAGAPYDGLLGDYDFGLTAAALKELFGDLAKELPALIDDAPRSTRALDVPVEAQRVAVARLLQRLGVEEESWRVDVSAHPFTTWMGRADTRITTRYDDGGFESLLSAIHEYGHGLYERQVDPDLERTNLGEGTSMSAHESQSKLWENHVGRNRAFAEVIAGDLRAAGFQVSPEELHAETVRVRRSLIRVAADPVTYPLHIVLRFELELAMIEGELATADLPDAWAEGMERLLGVGVPSDKLGCLQDVHWSAGSFGYFPSYALGCLIAAQLWEAMERELGSLDGALRRGEVAEIQRWLASNVHRHGRRLDTVPLLEQATGRGMEIAPFIRYATAIAEG